MSYRQIGKIVRLTDNGVRKRIRNLEHWGIIKSYRAWLDLDRIGRQYYKALISVRQFDDALWKKMLSFCMSEPSVVYLVVCTGRWDVELEAEVESEREFRNLLLRFRGKFMEHVGNYDILHVYRELKLVYFPFENYDDFTRFYEVKWVGVSRP